MSAVPGSPPVVDEEWSWLCALLREALLYEDSEAADEARELMSAYLLTHAEATP